MLLKLINSRLKRKITSYNEIPDRAINKINYHLQFPPTGYGRYFCTKFIKEMAKKYDIEGKTLLDVGAGHLPHKPFFNKIKYESCDSDQVIKEMNYDVLDAKHDFYCNINEKIPREDKSYDVVLCSDVLEHVYDPKNVIKEISRILKDDGVFIITVPQCGGEHMLPHNYFNYLGPGLEYLLRENGMVSVSLTKSGGGFHLIGTLLTKLVNTIFDLNNKNFFIKYLLLPISILFRIIILLINILLFYLDRFDKKKSWSTHYFAIAKKKV